MNNVDTLFAANGAPSEFASAYAGYFETLVRALDVDAVARFINALLNAREHGSRIFFIGNGGSASTASHFANDVAIGTRCPSRPFRAISLADNQAILTAVANDDGFDKAFVKQLEVLMEPDDILIAISASGNSPNLVAAVEYANVRGNPTWGLTGFDGGKLRQACSDVIHVATERGEYGPVEAVHAYLVHLVGNYLVQVVRSEASALTIKTRRLAGQPADEKS